MVMMASLVTERGTASHKPLREEGFSGKILRSHKFRSHRFYYDFTEITITTPPLTRILDRLT